MKEIAITYCKPCGYLKQAIVTADLLRKELGVEVRLVPGKGGIFHVSVDGNVVAKRTRAGFPSNEEIIVAVSDDLGRIS